KTHNYVDKARALAPDSPQLLFAQGLVALRERQYTESLRFADQAIRTSPSYADAYVLMANTLVYLGKSAEALSVMVDAEQLNPRMPSIYLRIRGTAHYSLGHYLQAIADYERSREANPNYQQLRVWLAAAYAASGRLDDARWEVEEARMLNPLITMAWMRRLIAMIDPALREQLLADLSDAGLPE
ncbi:MAG: tetratricopeptide repeat protein, partial [Sedimenticolaceae bacterium]